MMAEAVKNGHIKPTIPQQAKEPFFGIKIIDDASYLLYALAMYALDTGAFSENPIAEAKIDEMRQGLLNVYRQLNVLEEEYGKFRIPVEQKEEQEEINETSGECQEEDSGQ